MSSIGRADVFGTVLAELGPDVAFRLIEEFAGTRLFIGKVPREGSRIVSAIGMQAACRLSAKLGSDTIKLPLARSWRVQVYRARGWTHSRIANAVGVSDATVARLLKDMGLTNPPGRRGTPEGVIGTSLVPPPLTPVRMLVVRRGTGPDLPLFPGPSETMPILDAGREPIAVAHA